MVATLAAVELLQAVNLKGKSLTKRTALKDIKISASKAHRLCLPSLKSKETQLKIYGGYCGGGHLFPFRTEKLSPLTPMVLQKKAGEQEAATEITFLITILNLKFMKTLFQKGSSWMKKAPSKLSVCILTVLMHIVLAMGNYRIYQDCPCQQHADEILSNICDIESTLREYNEYEEEERKKKRKFEFLRDGERKE